MKKQFKLINILLISMGLFFVSCEKDDPVPEIDQEVITEVNLTFTEIDEAGQPIPGSAFEVVARDPEGISLGGSPVVDDISALETGKKYQLDISLFNNIAGEDVTEEIAEDDTEHQFYILGSAFVGNEAFLTYVYNDVDENGNPLGLQGFVTVDESAVSSTGTMRLILRHDLDKEYTGADHPNFENYEQAGGETDLDISFQVIL